MGGCGLCVAKGVSGGAERKYIEMGHKQDFDKRFEKLVRALGFAVMNLQKASELPGEDGVRVTEIRLKLDADNRTSVLVVVKGIDDEGAVVGFTGGRDLEAAVLSLEGRLKAGTMRWREDRPWKPA